MSWKNAIDNMGKIKNITLENEMKSFIKIVKENNTVLGEKMTIFLDNQKEMFRIYDELLKYVMDTIKTENRLDKVMEYIWIFQIYSIFYF